MSYKTLVPLDSVVTDAERLGLDSVHVSPGVFTYLFHGLKSPFVVHQDLEMHVLRGERYVHGLMVRIIQCSKPDRFLHLT